VAWQAEYAKKRSELVADAKEMKPVHASPETSSFLLSSLELGDTTIYEP
jgi:hypothetical protein